MIMIRVLVTRSALLLGALVLLPACGFAQTPESSAEDTSERAFTELQSRGQQAMGVDQYTSTHLFDVLPDGGRIELQRGVDDPEGVAEIRRHLQEIRDAFSRGDFSTPAFVHAEEVPGTRTLTARGAHVEYVYRDLPRGGEVRLVTQDAEALEAIREFMAYQRSDHRSGGMDHGSMDHGSMDHGSMNHESMDHQSMDHQSMNHGAMNAGGGGMHGRGMMGGMKSHDATAGHSHAMAGRGGDEAFAGDMDLVHGLLVNHRVITRTVEHLPDGIRTLTTSADPEVARLLVAHVASMERRLNEGEVFNLFSHTIPTIFEHYDRIRTRFEYDSRGVSVVQTSDDPALVTALQAHAAEVTELVDEGMAAMMRGMMSAGGSPATGGTMEGSLRTGHVPGGMHGAGGPEGMRGDRPR